MSDASSPIRTRGSHVEGLTADTRWMKFIVHKLHHANSTVRGADDQWLGDGALNSASGPSIRGLYNAIERSSLL